MNNTEPKLCYIRDCWAYFTTQNISQQWGDDWDDAPYEHNAETPYEYTKHDKARGLAPWIIIKVAFDGDFDQPCSNRFNSCWCVRDINKGKVPWLTSPSYVYNKIEDIYAGATLDQFCERIKHGGGEVYMKKD